MTTTSEEASRREIWAQSFPDMARRLQVSTNGGSLARWRKDGRELYFIGANRALMAADVDEKTGHVGIPRPLFDTYPPSSAGSFVVYDVAADGQRFLIARPRPEALVPATTLIMS